MYFKFKWTFTTATGRHYYYYPISIKTTKTIKNELFKIAFQKMLIAWLRRGKLVKLPVRGFVNKKCKLVTKTLSLSKTRHPIILCHFGCMDHIWLFQPVCLRRKRQTYEENTSGEIFDCIPCILYIYKKYKNLNLQLPEPATGLTKIANNNWISNITL